MLPKEESSCARRHRRRRPAPALALAQYPRRRQRRGRPERRRRLHELGQKDIAVVTEEFGGGTSLNTGSDKQTYYKLSLAGGRPDSSADMARDLHAGAPCTATSPWARRPARSGPSSLWSGLGVPFPHDRYGAFVGYKTDHDPRRRATSAGPLTSRLMAKPWPGRSGGCGSASSTGIPSIGLLTADPVTGRSPANPKIVGRSALDEARLSPARFRACVAFDAPERRPRHGRPGRDIPAFRLPRKRRPARTASPSEPAPSATI